jgi:hypothetical protein
MTSTPEATSEEQAEEFEEGASAQNEYKDHCGTGQSFVASLYSHGGMTYRSRLLRRGT